MKFIHEAKNIDEVVTLTLWHIDKAGEHTMDKTARLLNTHKALTVLEHKSMVSFSEYQRKFRN